MVCVTLLKMIHVYRTFKKSMTLVMYIEYFALVLYSQFFSNYDVNYYIDTNMITHCCKSL